MEFYKQVLESDHWMKQYSVNLHVRSITTENSKCANVKFDLLLHHYDWDMVVQPQESSCQKCNPQHQDHLHSLYIHLL